MVDYKLYCLKLLSLNANDNHPYFVAVYFFFVCCFILLSYEFSSIFEAVFLKQLAYNFPVLYTSCLVIISRLY